MSVRGPLGRSGDFQLTMTSVGVFALTVTFLTGEGTVTIQSTFLLFLSLFMYHLGNNWQCLHLGNNWVSPPGETDSVSTWGATECSHLAIDSGGYALYKNLLLLFYLGELTMSPPGGTDNVTTWGTTDNSLCPLNSLLFLAVYSHLVDRSQTVVIYSQCPALTQYPSTT